MLVDATSSDFSAEASDDMDTSEVETLRKELQETQFAIPMWTGPKPRRGLSKGVLKPTQIFAGPKAQRRNKNPKNNTIIMIIGF